MITFVAQSLQDEFNTSGFENPFIKTETYIVIHLHNCFSLSCFQAKAVV